MPKAVTPSPGRSGLKTPCLASISLTSTMACAMDSSLHSKDAERRLRDGPVETSRDAERDRLARVERVDDAVVPEARRRVVRVALVLVLRADLLRLHPPHG